MALFTHCRKHGRQLAVGNYDECEKCLIEYKFEQVEKEFGMGRKHKGVSYNGTVFTGEF